MLQTLRQSCSAGDLPEEFKDGDAVEADGFLRIENEVFDAGLDPAEPTQIFRVLRVSSKMLIRTSG